MPKCNCSGVNSYTKVTNYIHSKNKTIQFNYLKCDHCKKMVLVSKLVKYNTEENSNETP